MSGLVRARGLKLNGSSDPQSNLVRARKSPWIETACSFIIFSPSLSGLVRARGLKLFLYALADDEKLSGLVRARGLKPEGKLISEIHIEVRARKSPWIETILGSISRHGSGSGLVRARGLKLRDYPLRRIPSGQGS